MYRYHTRGRVGLRLATILVCALVASLAAQAQIMTKPAGPVDPLLLDLHSTYTAGAQTAGTVISGNLVPAPLQVRDDKFVLVDIVAAGDIEDLEADLADLGMESATTHGRICSGWLPIDAIDELAGKASLRVARASLSTQLVGAATSQGDAAMGSDAVRALYGLDGSGVQVGVLSDTFDDYDGTPVTTAADDIASGDLPAGGVTVLDDTGGPGMDEGRAMLQLVHDVAPGADLSFHTATGGQAAFADGILDLAAAGANIIVDDALYLAEPMFQDGVIAQAVDAVEAMGVSYFSSAGNNARNSYESEFRASGITGAFGGMRHDFDPGPGVDDLQSFTIGTGLTIFSFQWTEPAFSVSGAPGSASDLDIVLYLPGGVFVGLGGFLMNVGGDPIEVFGVANFGPPTSVELGLELFDGPAPGLMKYVYFGPSSSGVVEFDTSSGTVFGHANAAGASAIGAALYTQTPAFGVDPPEVEAFSSAGGTPIYFTPDGTPTYELRAKPELVGPDGGNTTFFPGADLEPDGLPNFYGTSASAPHVAGVAALVLQGSPSMTPSDVYSLLETTAIDMDDPYTTGFDVGYDAGTGYGLVDAVAAISVLAPAPPHAFTVLGNQKIVFDKPLVTEGEMHSNGNIELRGQDTPTTHSGSLSAVDDIKIEKRNVVDGDATAGGKVELKDDAIVTGTVTEQASVDVVPLPDLNYSDGSLNVVVPKNTTESLPPGLYHDVTVQDGATLNLTGGAGAYYFHKLEIRKEATLSADVSAGPLTVNATDQVLFDNGARLDAAPAGPLASLNVWINSMNKIEVRQDAVVVGNFVAPSNRLEVRDDAFVQGSLCAKEILVREGATIVGHGSTLPVPPPAAKAAQPLRVAEALEVPNVFELGQNYPNPFNPATTIAFALPESRRVKLDVYDVTGRHVDTLVDGVVGAGRHQVSWEAGDRPTGMYIYRIVTEDRVEARRMMLVR